jgi:aldose 1-epimerase
MPFTVTTKPVSAGGKTDTVYFLGDTAETVRAEVWPGFGFNCLRWQVRRTDGGWGDVLYCDPTWEQNPVPTRSGHPILFPFPNRLAHGRFTFEGREYQLPLNESTGAHAIHGFTPRNPWRVVGAGVERDHAWISGQFQLSHDLPGSLGLWPADFVLHVNYQLFADTLFVNCRVENPDSKPLPFGIGYHPYFCCPNVPNTSADEMVLQAATGERWELDGGLPTGKREPATGEFDFRTAREVGATNLDTLYTIDPATPRELACLGHRTAPGRLSVLADPPFNHAANLPDAGWRVLPPGGEFAASVAYRWAAG